MCRPRLVLAGMISPENETTQSNGSNYIVGQLHETGHTVGPTSLQTRDLSPMLNQCWADVVDGGPTWKQHCGNVSRFLGFM